MANLKAVRCSLRLVIFDGICGLCNHFIDFLLRNDHRRELRYTPIQGETAKSFGLLPEELTNPKSIVFVDDDGAIYRESTAVLRAIAAMGGVWRGFLLFLCIPAFIRDFFYKRVANNRYRLFGKRDSCRLPTPEERTFFLS